MQTVGHRKQLKLLRGFLTANGKKNNLFFSSYLFWGPEKIGKRMIAEEFIKGLLCQKSVFGGCDKCPACLDVSKRDFLLVDENFLPNLVIKSEDEKPYGIDTSRAVIKFLATSPSMAQRKVVLIDNAHLLTQEAQNSLLKIIEEPPSNAVIVLVSHKPSFLYDTILSRLLQIYFPLVNEKELSAWVKNSFSTCATPEAPARRVNAKEADEIVKFSLGRPGRASEFVNDKSLLSKFKKNVLALLSFEGKTSGQKLILLKNFFNQEPDLPGDLSLWQGVLRDELLFSCGFEDLAGILSQKRQAETTDLIASLKKLLSLSDLSDNFPATTEAVFKQMVLSKSL
jgi:DNA polymerase-3 subunit delta'